MRVCYKSYLEFLLKADVLTRELALNPKEAAELLARVSGYANHCTMPIGQENDGPVPSREDLVIRLLALLPDIGAKRACEIVNQLDLPLSGVTPSLTPPAMPTDARHPVSDPLLQ